MSTSLQSPQPRPLISERPERTSLTFRTFQDALLQVCAPKYSQILFMVQILMRDSVNSFFKTLVDHEVTVELKNDIQIRGTLKSVDQYLNIKLDDIQVVEELKYPHLVSTMGSAG